MGRTLPGIAGCVGVAFLLLLVLPVCIADAGAIGAESARISGVVIDEAGQPVRGAQVWLATHWFWLDEDGGATGPQETGDDGKFELSPPARWLSGPPLLRQELGIVAWSDRHGIGALGLYRESPLPAEPLEVKLAPLVTATIEVLSHEERALADARVRPVMIQCDVLCVDATPARMTQLATMFGGEPKRTPRGPALPSLAVSLPEELQRRLEASTDAGGKAAVSGVPLSQLAAVAIEGDQFGRQVFQQNPTRLIENDEGLARLQLNRPVRATGQVIGPPGAVAGKRLRLLCAGTYDGPRQISSYATADLTLPAEGQFSARLCEGQVWPLLAWDTQSPLRPVATQPTIQADGENHLEIKVEPAVLVYGHVKDWDTDQPVPEARVMLRGGWWSWQTLITDKDGRYEALVAPGPVSVDAVVAADRFLLPQQRQQVENQIAAGKTMELKPIVMRQTRTVAGSAVDDAGQPIAGATVEVAWGVESRTVATDDRGRFEVRGIVPGSPVRVSAAKGGAYSGGVAIIKESQPAMVLPLSPRNAVSLAGRVVDSGGAPVAGAKLQLWHRPWSPVWTRPVLGKARSVSILTQEEPDPRDALVADEHGRFRTPPLRPDGSYRITLADHRYESAHGAWFDVSDGQTPAEFELVARRLGEHQGTVRDSAGHAIGGALVEFQAESKRTQARTDAEGRFLLKPAPDGPGMLFVSRDGYRFHGQEVKALAGPLDVRLARFDEPYGQALRPPPPATTPDQRLKIARQLIQEFLDEPRNDARQEDRMLALRSLATFDPAAALAEVQARPLRDGRMNDMVRYEAAKALLDTAPDDALELAEAVGREFPHMTPMLYVRIAAALPADQRQRKLEILGEALVRAQAIQEPGFRLVTVAQVAEGLLDLGEKERGTKLLLENLETAQKFNRSGYDAYLRGAFAEELAQVDLESALALVNEITDYSERTRHLANIAHEIAGQRPADAEKILADYPPPPEGSRLINQKDQYGVRICYRMAGADLVRALRIAEAMEDPFYKAHSFGVMAAAIGPSDRVKAAELVRRGFDSLDEAASRPVQELPVSGGNLGNVGGWLVAQAHELDPELAAETRWRLLRVLPDQPSADPNRRWRDTEALSSAAMFLAQLDPPLARSLLERLDGDPQFVAAGSNSRTWLPAWGMLDPSEAIKRAAMQAAAVRSRAKATLAEAIASSGQARQRLLHYQAGLWRIDVEDIDN